MNIAMTEEKSERRGWRGGRTERESDAEAHAESRVKRHDTFKRVRTNSHPLLCSDLSASVPVSNRTMASSNAVPTGEKSYFEQQRELLLSDVANVSSLLTNAHGHR